MENFTPRTRINVNEGLFRVRTKRENLRYLLPADLVLQGILQAKAGRATWKQGDTDKASTKGVNLGEILTLKITSVS